VRAVLFFSFAVADAVEPQNRWPSLLANDQFSKDYFFFKKSKSKKK